MHSPHKPHIDTVVHEDFKAEIYSRQLPGQFKVVYRDPSGNILEEITYSGISTYKQRHSEITAKLRELWATKRGKAAAVGSAL